MALMIDHGWLLLPMKSPDTVTHAGSSVAGRREPFHRH